MFSETIGLLFGTMFEDDKVTSSLTPLFYGPIFVFGGYLINVHLMYDWVSWVQYLSPLRYTFEILLKSEFDDNPKYQYNANDRYGLNFGVTNCFLALITLIV